MKIAIDCRALRKKKLTGVANFLISVINNIADQHPEWVLYLISNEEFSDESNRQIHYSDHTIKVVQPLPIFSSVAVFWYILKANSIIKMLDVDIFYTPTPTLPFFFPNKIKSLITVFDMVFKEYSHTMSASNWLLNFISHDSSIKRADGIWSISIYSKERLDHFFPRRRQKKTLVGIGTDNTKFFYSPISDDTRLATLRKYDLQIGKKTILFVGTLEPRKNLSFLISIMPDLGHQGFQLLIVGAKGWNGEFEKLILKSKSIEDNIRFSGFIDDAELRTLYQVADVFVSPSLNEGFGLPLLEAMTCGCPVVAAKNSGMMEVVADAGVQVDGWDRLDWIDAIKKVSDNHDHFRDLGLKQAEKFDWKIIIADLTAYLDEIQRNVNT